jgi:hypothetical protein
LIDTKETLQIRALREQAPAALEIYINFIIVRYLTEHWVQDRLKAELSSRGRIKPRKPGLLGDFWFLVAIFLPKPGF